MVFKVMVVDDSATIRTQLRSILKSHFNEAVEIVEASDGKEGIVALEKHSDVALILSDINMPNMSGLEMLELVKADPRHKDLAIIMLTTEGNSAQMNRARELGAKAWILKPYRQEDIIRVMSKFLIAKA